MHRYGHLLRTLKAFRNTQGHLWTVLRLSHGENRGSSPLGSANDFNYLMEIKLCGLAGISNFSPIDGTSEDWFEATLRSSTREGRRDWRSHRRAGIGAYLNL